MGRTDSPLRFWLGRQVAVVVDRPLGSRHPRHPDTVYPVNYGYIPNTEAGDLEPIDAYILGVDVPVSSFIGEVVAIVIRRDDVEGKLVVGPAGTTASRGDIERAIRFQEQYFDSYVIVAHPDND